MDVLHDGDVFLFFCLSVRLSGCLSPETCSTAGGGGLLRWPLESTLSCYYYNSNKRYIMRLIQEVDG